MFPELQEYLAAEFEAAEPGTIHVITRHRRANLRTELHRIIARAGLKPWGKPFQNLRSTRETELCETFPAHVVCAWIGNSESVARKHYLQVTDVHFDAAVTGGAKGGAALARHEPPGAASPNSKPQNVRGMQRVTVPVSSKDTPGRNRTCDLRFRKPSLYPLSYGGTFFDKTRCLTTPGGSRIWLGTTSGTERRAGDAANRGSQAYNQIRHATTRFHCQNDMHNSSNHLAKPEASVSKNNGV